MQRSSLNFVFINGRGSSGKDTQADLLVAQNPHAVRISTGDIIRGARTPDNEYGRFNKQIQPYIELVDRGEYVPDEVILDIVGQVIKEQMAEGKDTFIFTGFPRTEEQLRAVDEYTQSLEGDSRSVSVNYISYAVLDVHSKRRAEQRRETALHKGIAVRKDDEPSTIDRRLKAYRDLTEPMLHKLAREKRLLVIKSNGTIPEVQERTKIALEKANKRALEGQRPTPEIHGNPHKER